MKLLRVLMLAAAVTSAVAQAAERSPQGEANQLYEEMCGLSAAYKEGAISLLEFNRRLTQIVIDADRAKRHGDDGGLSTALTFYKLASDAWSKYITADVEAESAERDGAAFALLYRKHANSEASFRDSSMKQVAVVLEAYSRRLQDARLAAAEAASAASAAKVSHAAASATRRKH